VYVDAELMMRRRRNCVDLVDILRLWPVRAMEMAERMGLGVEPICK